MFTTFLINLTTKETSKLNMKLLVLKNFFVPRNKSLVWTGLSQTAAGLHGYSRKTKHLHLFQKKSHSSLATLLEKQEKFKYELICNKGILVKNHSVGFMTNKYLNDNHSVQANIFKVILQLSKWQWRYQLCALTFCDAPGTHDF